MPATRGSPSSGRRCSGAAARRTSSCRASGVEHTRDWLLEHSTLTERIYEDVGHWITDAELGDVNSFLRALTPE